MVNTVNPVNCLSKDALAIATSVITVSVTLITIAESWPDVSEDLILYHSTLLPYLATLFTWRLSFSWFMNISLHD
jgi:hypothetical protein